VDGIRGLAISLVMLHHSFQNDDPQPVLPDRLVFGLAGSGWSGVDLFFVLSGFLITGILLDSRGQTHYFRNFYGRRTLRIFPLYYAVLLVFFVGFTIVPHPLFARYVEDAVEDQLWFWTYLTNVRIAIRGEWYDTLIPDILWSLAIEEQFYLIWPVLILACSARTLMAICLGLFAGALATRLALAFAGVEPIVSFVLTLTRMDGLALGALIALLSREQTGLDGAVWWAKRVAPVSLLILLGLALPSSALDWEDPWTSTVGFSLLALLYGAMLVLVVKGDPGAELRRFFEMAFMRMLGKYSYALYLFHGPVGTLVKQVYEPEVAPLVMGSALPRVLLFTILTASLSLLVAWVSWNVLERRCLALQRWFRNPSPSMSGARTA
jgi:peptidoglycan/LPS O-acetylase OafA/YrhL